MIFLSVEKPTRQLEVAKVFSILNSHNGVAPSSDISYTMHHPIVQENVFKMKSLDIDNKRCDNTEIDCHRQHKWGVGGSMLPSDRLCMHICV